MNPAFPLTISALALFISALTAWLTLLRRGTVKMTQPTVIYFGRDSAGYGPPKVFLRALLYPTAKRGRVVQSMHVTLSRNEARQNFHIWVYGQRDGMVRGSGLYVGETGVAANHHFMIPKNSSKFEFVEGVYKLEVFAQLVGDKSAIPLLEQTLEVSRENATAMTSIHTGLYFDWGPDSQRYLSHLDVKGAAPTPEELAEAIGMPRDLEDESS